MRPLEPGCRKELLLSLPSLQVYERPLGIHVILFYSTNFAHTKLAICRFNSLSEERDALCASARRTGYTRPFLGYSLSGFFLIQVFLNSIDHYFPHQVEGNWLIHRKSDGAFAYFVIGQFFFECLNT